MTEKDITRAAYKLLKYTNGNVCYSALCNYIQSKGFIVVELHTKEGDEILKKFDYYDEYSDLKGISIIGKSLNIVIIDSTLSAHDKLHILLHEIGHIVLHLSNRSTFDDISKVERENQAEIFAFKVQHFSKAKYWIYKLTNKCG